MEFIKEAQREKAKNDSLQAARASQKEDLEFYMKCLRELRDPSISSEEVVFYRSQMKRIEGLHKGVITSVAGDNSNARTDENDGDD